MRILFLTLKTFSATGGIEKFNRSFAKALLENGMENGDTVTIYSAYDDEPDEQYVPKNAFRGFGGRRPAFFLAALKACFSTDVLFFAHINLAPLVMLAGILQPGKRRIMLVHGREVWKKPGAIQKSALTICNEIWSVSRYTADIVRRNTHLSAARFRIFPNTPGPFFGDGHPLDPSVLRSRYGIMQDEKVIITVARLADTEKFKGYDLVLQALPFISEHVPKLRYVLCGKWDEVEKERILGLIDDLRLHDLVILTGFISDAELAAHYRMADVFVLPSTKEGFGIVFIEAAWCGLQVIGGNRDGSAEALLGGKLGTLVDPGNPVQVQEAILKALTQPLTPQQRGEQRNLVEAHFSFRRFKQLQYELLTTQKINEQAGGVPGGHH